MEKARTKVQGASGTEPSGLQMDSATERALLRTLIDLLPDLIFIKDRDCRFVMANQIERASRYSTPLALVMADLDAFKRINDTHGHTVGDEVLVCFSQRARLSLRQSSDWMSRFGGEEFAIVLPQTDRVGACVVAEKVRAHCSSSPFKTSAGALQVTVSLGVAALAQGTPVTVAMTALLSRADAALYQSKRDGRDRVSGRGR